MTLTAFYALIAGLDRRYRPVIATIAWRYGDLRARGFTRGQARQRIEDVTRFDHALRALGIRDEFRSITD